MTVAEIKEYIKNKISNISRNEQITNYKGETTGVQISWWKGEDVINELTYILSMLDELEPKAKWVKTQLSFYDDDYGYECSNCKEIYCTDEYDFEEMSYNYCPNCGARMEVENDTTPTNV